MRKSLSANLRFIFLLGDLAILNGTALVGPLAFGRGVLPEDGLTTLLAALNGGWLILSILFKPYRFSRVSRFAKILRNHLTFIFFHMIFVAAILFGLNDKTSNVVLAGIFGMSIMLLLFWRIFYFYLNKIVINKKLNFKNVVIVGVGDLAWEMRKFFRLHPEFGYRFLGYFHDKAMPERDVYAFDQLDSYCKNNEVHEIYCCLPYTEHHQVKTLIDYGLSNLIKVKLITDYRGFFSRGVSLENYDNIPVLNVAAVPLDERNNQLIKRLFDVIFSSLVILLILSWLTPIIAILIKLDSRGPVFFKQKRAGQGNRPFNCLKFRTMVIHNREFMQATKDDVRVTRVGKFLRKTSLDELPQFVNVLKGEMSIIGPRPHPLKLNEEFSPRIEKFMVRHYIKPGITGLAQAKGYRGETRTDHSMRGRVKLDRFYIENWSFLLDIKIIIATIIALAKGDQQAY